ncbi:mitochondrial fission regulator 2 [Rhinoraja longicauda]
MHMGMIEISPESVLLFNENRVVNALNHLMSHLLNFICEVLEYFGISPDVLKSLWQSKPYGQTRSIVRRIGSSLPLNCWSKVHFQVLEGLSVAHLNSYTPKPTVPSLADVAWIADDDGDVLTRYRNEWHPAKAQCKISSHHKSTTSVNHLKKESNAWNQGVSNENALNKIAQLEDELSSLKSQMAMIILKQDQRPGSACSSQFESNGFAIPGTPTFIPPRSASTPLGALNHPSMTATEPKMLPPPPPPLPSATKNNVVATKDLNQECQALKINSSHVTIKPKLIEKPSKSFNMMDVLQDMQKVKLRIVERSPGGTPRREKPAKKAPISDPAALIADALKRKFAHRYLNDSSDKENESSEFSPLSSPETLKFGQHIPKHDNRNNILKTGKII